MRTHYDNLKVSQSASQDEIKSSYRRLCSIHHPDKHPEDKRKRQNEIIKIINLSYSVLSDPKLRAKHDAWILSQSQSQNQNQNIYNDFDFEKVKDKTISFIKITIGIVLSLIIITIGAVIDKIPTNTENNKETESRSFERSFNMEAMKSKLPQKIDDITTLKKYYAVGFNIHYVYEVSRSSVDFDFNALSSSFFGDFRNEEVCKKNYIYSELLSYNFEYQFLGDNKTFKITKPLSYLCGR